jgi:hypothetical protein
VSRAFGALLLLALGGCASAPGADPVIHIFADEEH